MGLSREGTVAEQELPAGAEGVSKARLGDVMATGSLQGSARSGSRL